MRRRCESSRRSSGPWACPFSGNRGGRSAGNLPSRRTTDIAPLEPGSNIVVPLIRGDLDASAGGTVTYIDGDKLYAFGHDMFDLGSTDLPMHKGLAITVFPSLQSSFKILETGEPVGAIRQDRGRASMAFSGRITHGAPAGPFDNEQRSQERSQIRVGPRLSPYAAADQPGRI